MKDGAELINDEFFPLFRSVVTSIIRERATAEDSAVGASAVVKTVISETVAHSDSSDDSAPRRRRRLTGRQRLTITR